MSCYAVIDTNVIVSALISKNDDAATVCVVKRMLLGEIIPLYSGEITKEYRDVLNRGKFGFDPALTEYLVSAIEQFGILVDCASPDVILPDMKDVPFYKIVLNREKDNTYLVTGNIKHFPKEPFIVTPRELLDILDGKAETVRNN